MKLLSQSLYIFKQNLKFSAAHFLIFDHERAERLHGHNYQVLVTIQVPKWVGPHGYGIDFGKLKKILRELVDEWDERVLLPQNHPDFSVKEYSQDTWLVRFRDRTYAFPKEEVLWLPTSNTSVEELSRLFVEKFCSSLSGKVALLSPIEVEVRIEETPGQGASCRVQWGGDVS